MIYVFGIIGFIGGFAMGQMVLLYLLKNRSQEELLENPKLKWTYGLLNWIFAGVGIYSMVMVYKLYFA